MLRGKLVFLMVTMFVLVACRGNEVEIPMQKDLTGTWLSVQDELFDTYEFNADGTGTMRRSSNPIEYYDLIPFTYSFASPTQIKFSAEEGHEIFINLAMPSPNELSYDAQVEGGYHIDFVKIGDCSHTNLSECVVGSWVRYGPNNSFTVYDFYHTGEGIAFVPEVEGVTHFTFVDTDDSLIRYQVENEDAVDVNASFANNYKMVFEFPDGKEEPIEFYRIEAPFGP